MTKYTVNGKPVTQAKAEELVRSIMPNGGVQFIQNAIRNARTNKLERCRNYEQFEPLHRCIYERRRQNVHL